MSATAPQHMMALGQANEVRLARARSKRNVKAGRVSLAVALELPCWQSAPTIDLLMAYPRWGRVRALKLLYRSQVSERRPVGSLTPRQRAALVEAFDDGRGGWT